MYAHGVSRVENLKLVLPRRIQDVGLVLYAFVPDQLLERVFWQGIGFTD